MEVHYLHTMQIDTIRLNQTETDSMILRIGEHVSQFFSWHKFYYDSLWNDPKGREMVEELTLKAFQTRDHSKEPRVRTTSDYIYKHYPEGKMTVTNDRFYVGCRYEENHPTQQWTVEDSTRNILGYTCHKATCDFRGRQWTTWFTRDIPFSDGPWKLCGLPGLILEAYDKKNDYHYVAVRISEADLRPVVFYCFDGKDFFPTDRETFLRSLYAYLTGGGNVYEIELIKTLVREGRRQTYMQRTPRKLFYDLLERDYR